MKVDFQACWVCIQKLLEEFIEIWKSGLRTILDSLIISLVTATYSK